MRDLERDRQVTDIDPSDDETVTKSKTENAPTSLLFLQASNDDLRAYNLGLKVT